MCVGGGEVAGGQTVAQVVGLGQGQSLHSLRHFWGVTPCGGL